MTRTATFSTVTVAMVALQLLFIRETAGADKIIDTIRRFYLGDDDEDGMNRYQTDCIRQNFESVWHLENPPSGVKAPSAIHFKVLLGGRILYVEFVGGDIYVVSKLDEWTVGNFWNDVAKTGQSANYNSFSVNVKIRLETARKLTVSTQLYKGRDEWIELYAFEVTEDKRFLKMEITEHHDTSQSSLEPQWTLRYKRGAQSLASNSDQFRLFGGVWLRPGDSVSRLYIDSKPDGGFDIFDTLADFPVDQADIQFERPMELWKFGLNDKPIDFHIRTYRISRDDGLISCEFEYPNFRLRNHTNYFIPSSDGKFLVQVNTTHHKYMTKLRVPLIDRTKEPTVDLNERHCPVFFDDWDSDRVVRFHPCQHFCHLKCALQLRDVLCLVCRRKIEEYHLVSYTIKPSMVPTSNAMSLDDKKRKNPERVKTKNKSNNVPQNNRPVTRRNQSQSVSDRQTTVTGPVRTSPRLSTVVQLPQRSSSRIRKQTAARHSGRRSPERRRSPPQPNNGI